MNKALEFSFYNFVKDSLIKGQLPEDLRKRAIELIVKCAGNFTNTFAYDGVFYTLTPEQYSEIMYSIKEDKIIEAIKKFRSYNSSGLLAAKSIVQTIAKDSYPEIYCREHK